MTKWIVVLGVVVSTSVAAQTEDTRSANMRAGQIGFSLDDGKCELFDGSGAAYVYRPIETSGCRKLVAWISGVHPLTVRPLMLYSIASGTLRIRCRHFEHRSSSCEQFIGGVRSPVYIGLGDSTEVWPKWTGRPWAALAQTIPAPPLSTR